MTDFVLKDITVMARFCSKGHYNHDQILKVVCGLGRNVTCSNLPLHFELYSAGTILKNNAIHSKFRTLVCRNCEILFIFP